MHCNNYLYPVIKGCFKQNYKNPNQCLTYNFRAMLNIDLDNLMLWQILHPIPPCISFSLLPPNPCVCNLVYRESQSKGMVPYRVLTNHPSCKLKGAGKRRGWGRGRRGGCCKAESPYPTIWMDTFCVRAVQLAQSSWSKASSMDTTEWKSKREIYFTRYSDLSPKRTPSGTSLCHRLSISKMVSFGQSWLHFSYNPCKNAWGILWYFFLNENSNSLCIDWV